MERIVVSVQTEDRGLSLRIAETMALRTEQIRMIPGDPGERGSDWDFILITEAAGAVPGDLLILPGDGMIRRLSEQQEQGREESLSGISHGFMPGQVVTEHFRITWTEEDPLPAAYRDSTPIRFRIPSCRADQMERELSLLYGELTGAPCPGKERKDIPSLVAFCGLSGGAGTTFLALAAGQMLDRIYGTKTIYLSLCAGDDSDLFCGEGPETVYSLNHVMYRMGEGRDVPLGPLVQENLFLRRFVFRRTGRDIGGITQEQLRRFLQETAKQLEPDVVVMDLGHGISEGTGRILSLADCIVPVGRAGDFRLAHVRRTYRDILQYSRADHVVTVRNFEPAEQEPDPEQIFRRRTFERWREEEAENPTEKEDCRENARDGGESEDLPDFIDHGEGVLSVSDAPDAFIRMGGRIRMDLSGPFGMECAAVAKKIAGVTHVREYWPEG